MQQRQGLKQPTAPASPKKKNTTPSSSRPTLAFAIGKIVQVRRSSQPAKRCSSSLFSSAAASAPRQRKRHAIVLSPTMYVLETIPSRETYELAGPSSSEDDGVGMRELNALLLAAHVNEMVVKVGWSIRACDQFAVEELSGIPGLRAKGKQDMVLARSVSSSEGSEEGGGIRKLYPMIVWAETMMANRRGGERVPQQGSRAQFDLVMMDGGAQ